MKPVTLGAHQAGIRRAHAGLAAHLDTPPDLTALARIAGVSLRQLDRLFIRIVGESPRACQRRLRLERAAQRLRSTRRRILAAALEAGFGSHEAFTRSFRQHFGQTPAAYRSLPTVSQQPAHRRSLWQLALAGGLRAHVEHPPPPSINIGS